MGMGVVKKPSVKEVRPQVFYVSGLGGMGVAVAPVVGKAAAKLLLH
jgi:glycine/D-amino acid oxidase-like deaminating enzyme